MASLASSSVLLVLLLLVVSLTRGDFFKQGPGFTLYCRGNCSDVSPPTLPGTVLVGGGTDVDAAMVWLVQRAGGGNIVVLRAGPAGDDAYDEYIFDLAACQSVSTLIMNETVAAQQSLVLQTISQAEGLFFAGGDQSQYYNIWGRLGQGAINKAIAGVAQRGPVGGTSAGMAVLGHFVFTAEQGSIESPEALLDPLSPLVTLANDFLRLSYLGRVQTDMHFNTRDRMGRLLAFMANSVSRGWPQPVGFACNESTAMLLDGETGVGQLVGVGPAYAVFATGMPSVVAPNEPLSWANITVQKLMPGDLFSFRTFQRLDTQVPPYTLTVNRGVLSSSTGSIY